MSRAPTGPEDAPAGPHRRSGPSGPPTTRIRGPEPAPLRLRVNGADRTGSAAPRVTLLDYLRDELGLTGTHAGCEHGACGACTVMLDGDAVRACLLFAVMAEGREVTTVEGLAEPSDALGQTRLGLLQDCFWEVHALQCGYCTPGMLVAASALLAANPDPSDAEIRNALGGNLCRCTGYTQIVEAIRLAAQLASQRRPAGPPG